MEVSRWSFPGCLIIFIGAVLIGGVATVISRVFDISKDAVAISLMLGFPAIMLLLIITGVITPED